MQQLQRLAVVVGLLGTHSPAFAQGGSITTNNGSTIGGTLGGLGTGTSGSLGGGGLSGSSLGGTTLTTMETAPNIAPPAGTATGVLNTSNFLSGYYANPYYQGIMTNAKAGAAPGGFGQALYGTGGGVGGGNIGFAGSQTGATGRAIGGLGGVGGRTGGLGGATVGNANGGILAPVAAQIAYPAVVRFPSAPIAAPQLQADLRGMLARSVGTIANPAGIQVITEGGNVLLRGTVRDEDEARLVEGMVRLTPGVRQIRNELTFPTR